MTDPVAATRTCGTTSDRTDFDGHGYLNMYRVYHQVLTQSEDAALRLVEVEKASYADAANVLKVAQDDVKMLVFLARQKLYFGMGQTLAELSEEPAA